MGIGPWKDTVVPVANNYLQTPTDLVARAHALDLQVCFLDNPSLIYDSNTYDFVWTEIHCQKIRKLCSIIFSFLVLSDTCD